MFVSEQLECARPNVGGSEPCPVERDGFVEPDAVIFQAPESGQSRQEEDEQFGQGGGPEAPTERCETPGRHGNAALGG